MDIEVDNSIYLDHDLLCGSVRGRER